MTGIKTPICSVYALTAPYDYASYDFYSVMIASPLYAQNLESYIMTPSRFLANA